MVTWRASSTDGRSSRSRLLRQWLVTSLHRLSFIGVPSKVRKSFEGCERAMPLRRRTAALFYAINALVSLALGVLYLSRDRFMPYHEGALGQPWDAIEPALQTLLLALMDVAGAGWIALGVAVLMLTIFPFRRGETWSRILIPALFLIFYVPTLLATLAVLNQTPGSPPWYGNAVACAVAVIGFLLDAPWRADR